MKTNRLHPIDLLVLAWALAGAAAIHHTWGWWK